MKFKRTLATIATLTMTFSSRFGEGHKAHNVKDRRKCRRTCYVHRMKSLESRNEFPAPSSGLFGVALRFVLGSGAASHLSTLSNNYAWRASFMELHIPVTNVFRARKCMLTQAL